MQNEILQKQHITSCRTSRLRRWTRLTARPWAKRYMHMKLLPLLIISVILTGCLNEPCENMRFERFSAATKIRISTNHDKTLREITDQETITKISNFAIEHSDDWGTPVFGTPIAKIRANIYAGDKFLGDFGIGSDFLTAQGCRYFQSRSVSKKDRAILISLFGVQDPYEAK